MSDLVTRIKKHLEDTEAYFTRSGLSIEEAYDEDTPEGQANKLLAEAGDKLTVAEESASLGLGSENPKHWEAALQDILDVIRRGTT